MMILDWYFKLREDGVKVWCVRPGMLATGLGNLAPEVAKAMNLGHPSAGGTLLRKVVEGERDAEVGKIVNKDNISPW